VDPRTGLDDMEKIKFLTIPGFELRPLGRVASSQSLYRLSYPGSYHEMITNIYIVSLSTYFVVVTVSFFLLQFIERCQFTGISFVLSNFPL
jgi:hypothetical protein